MSKNKRHYLDKIGVDRFQDNMDKDKRNKKWKKQQKKYGFDERDTWNLDSTMAELLYERLCLFDKVNIIDTGWHKITFQEEEYTQQEAIDLLKNLLEKRLTENDLKKVYEAEVMAWELWLALIKAGIMWW